MKILFALLIILAIFPQCATNHPAPVLSGPPGAYCENGNHTPCYFAYDPPFTINSLEVP